MNKVLLLISKTFLQIKEKRFILVLILAGIIITLVVFLGKQTVTNLKPSTTVVASRSSVPIPTISFISDETSLWNTYTNTKVGFSVKYPPRYPTKPIEDNQTVIFGLPSEDAYYLEITPFQGTVEEFFQQTITGAKIQFEKMEFIKQTTVLGNKALWYKRIKNNSEQLEVYFTAVNHGFIFQSSMLNKTDLKELDIILSTFNFTSN